MGGRVLPRLLVVVVVLATAACGGVDRREPSPSREPPQGASRSEDSTPAPAGVQELTSIATLRERFEDDAGSTRLILLLSPT